MSECPPERRARPQPWTTRPRYYYYIQTGRLINLGEAMLRPVASILPLILTAACAAQADYSYQKPQSASVENSRTVNAPFDETWDRLVRNLSSEFFVINNIEKASRIINVSFSADTAESYVDCGETSRTYTSPAGRKEAYNYASAADSNYLYATPDGFPVGVDRRTSLEGRANIYVAPGEASPAHSTDIRVNVRYVMKVDFRFTSYNKYEQPLGSAGTDSITVSFDTTKPSDGSSGDMVCRSLGELEERILNAASR